jgi:hypothetical protein
MTDLGKLLREKLERDGVIEKDAVTIMASVQRNQDKFAKNGSVGAHSDKRIMGPLFNKEIHEQNIEKTLPDFVNTWSSFTFDAKSPMNDFRPLDVNELPNIQPMVPVKKGRWHGFNKLVVPGTKRKIVIYFSGVVKNTLTVENLKYVVQLASKKGWKKVYLKRDDHWGETIELVNLSQLDSNYRLGKSGIFISAPPCWESNYE